MLQEHLAFYSHTSIGTKNQWRERPHFDVSIVLHLCLFFVVVLDLVKSKGTSFSEEQLKDLCVKMEDFTVSTDTQNQVPIKDFSEHVLHVKLREIVFHISSYEF